MINGSRGQGPLGSTEALSVHGTDIAAMGTWDAKVCPGPAHGINVQLVFMRVTCACRSPRSWQCSVVLRPSMHDIYLPCLTYMSGLSRLWTESIGWPFQHWPAKMFRLLLQVVASRG